MLYGILKKKNTENISKKKTLKAER